jgi:hypothetical protein
MTRHLLFNLSGETARVLRRIVVLVEGKGCSPVPGLERRRARSQSAVAHSAILRRQRKWPKLSLSSSSVCSASILKCRGMMRLFELLSQALLVSRRDQEQATKPPSAPGHMPLDHLAQPLPNFMPRGNHSYDAVLSPDVDTVFADIKWTKDAIQTTRAFNAAIRDSRFRTLAEIIDTVVPNCGVSKTSGKSVNVTGMSTMVWQNDKTREGFTHHVSLRAFLV